jgi:septal ring factor EnvC (AmiA/AmiB activator)
MTTAIQDELLRISQAFQQKEKECAQLSTSLASFEQMVKSKGTKIDALTAEMASLQRALSANQDEAMQEVD